MSNSHKQKIDNLLFSTSQYEQEEQDSLRNQLSSAENKFLRNNKVLDLDQEVVFGDGGDSREEDQPRWMENYKAEGQEWNHQQHAKYYFREVAGNSQNFSQSLSFHRPDLLQSKGMHENSVNMDTININNILNAKKKQQDKVNEVLNTEISDLIQKIQKQECMIKSYKKKIQDLQDTIQNLKKQNEELDDRNKQYHFTLQKKDQLFNALKQQYAQLASAFEQKQIMENQYTDNIKSMEKEIDRLRNAMKSFSDQDKGLTDFTGLGIRRSQSYKSTASPTVNRGGASLKEMESKEVELEKLRREIKYWEKECETIKEDFCRKEEKFKSFESDLKRKISIKEEKIKELSQNLEINKEQITKMKKNSDSNANSLKDKMAKAEKELAIKQDKIKQLEGKIKFNNEQIKKKDEKILSLITENSDKNKKMAQLKKLLSQEQVRSQIETKLQNQRQNQIDKLSKEVNELKNDKFNLKRQMENMEKPTNVEQKLKKQITTLKSSNQMLTKQVGALKQSVSGLEKEKEAMDEKLREFKKKNDELSKKSVMSKKKSEDTELVMHENETYKEVISKMTKQMSQLRKKAQTNQEMANKYLILESRIKFNQPQTSPTVQSHNEYDLQQINEALKQELQNREAEIQEIKELHQKQIQRLVRENKTLVETIQRLDQEISFKEKSLDYMHQRFVEIEKENAELKANKNILHSSFYDESYDREENQAIHFYQNKVQSLEKKIQSLNSMVKEKDSQLRRIHSERQNSSFEISQLKNRIKDLQTMAIANEPSRKIAPESLSHEETIEFLLKLLKRIIKSAEMLKSLSRINDFKTIIGNLWKFMDKEPSKK